MVTNRAIRSVMPSRLLQQNINSTSPGAVKHNSKRQKHFFFIKDDYDGGRNRYKNNFWILLQLLLRVVLIWMDNFPFKSIENSLKLKFLALSWGAGFGSCLFFKWLRLWLRFLIFSRSGSGYFFQAAPAPRVQKLAASCNSGSSSWLFFPPQTTNVKL